MRKLFFDIHSCSESQLNFFSWTSGEWICNVKKAATPTEDLTVLKNETRRPDGSVGMALVLPALTDCRWWFESLLVHSEVSSATRRKATGADRKKVLKNETAKRKSNSKD